MGRKLIEKGEYKPDSGYDGYFGKQVVEDNQRATVRITMLAPKESQKPQGYKASRKRGAVRESG